MKIILLSFDLHDLSDFVHWWSHSTMCVVSNYVYTTFLNFLIWLRWVQDVCRSKNWLKNMDWPFINNELFIKPIIQEINRLTTILFLLLCITIFVVTAFTTTWYGTLLGHMLTPMGTHHLPPFVDEYLNTWIPEYLLACFFFFEKKVCVMRLHHHY